MQEIGRLEALKCHSPTLMGFLYASLFPCGLYHEALKSKKLSINFLMECA